MKMEAIRRELNDIGERIARLLVSLAVGIRDRIDDSAPHPAIDAWISMPIGVVTLAERHGGVTVSRNSCDVTFGAVAAKLYRGQGWEPNHEPG
jgi:hypothetical protein